MYFVPRIWLDCRPAQVETVEARRRPPPPPPAPPSTSATATERHATSRTKLHKSEFYSFTVLQFYKCRDRQACIDLVSACASPRDTPATRAAVGNRTMSVPACGGMREDACCVFVYNRFVLLLVLVEKAALPGVLAVQWEGELCLRAPFRLTLWTGAL